MTEREFSEAVAKALRLCRDAAALKLPVEEMLERVAEGIEEATISGLAGAATATEMLEALREIIAAVADVAAIGANLPPDQNQPAEPTYPLPGNLREA